MLYLRRLLMSLSLCVVMGQAQAADLVFAVTEGITYQTTAKEIQAHFQPLANLIGKALQKSVSLTIVPAYKDLRNGLNGQQFDIAFIHPAHLALEASKSGRYKTLAWTEGYTDYAVSFLAKANPPISRFADLKGKTIATTDPDSITALMVRAFLREQAIAPGEIQVTHTRFQDALPFYVEKGFAAAAATAAKGVVKAWTDGGGKIVTTTRGIPIKTVIASSKLSADDLEKIRNILLTKDKTTASALESLGYKGFVAPDLQQEQRNIAWLGL